MKISIITVCLNSKDTIAQTIQSVLGQIGFRDIEYIIIDGGSTDGTVEIIKEYESKLSYWESQRDNGIYDAMNKGIKKSTGEIIGLINSDDWYELDTLRIVNEIFTNDIDAQLLFGGLRFCSRDGDEIRISYPYKNANLWDGMNGYHPAMFARRSLYLKRGYYDCTYKIAADYKWILFNYLAGEKIIYNGNIFANFRMGGLSSNKLLLVEKEAYRVRREAIDCFISGDEKSSREKEAKSCLFIGCGKYLFREDCHMQYENIIKMIPDVDKGIYIYGYGKYGKKVFKLLVDNGIKVLGVIDNDEKKVGEVLSNDIVIQSFGDINDISSTVLISMLKGCEEVKKTFINTSVNAICLKDILLEIGKSYVINTGFAS